MLGHAVCRGEFRVTNTRAYRQLRFVNVRKICMVRCTGVYLLPLHRCELTRWSFVFKRGRTDDDLFYWSAQHTFVPAPHENSRGCEQVRENATPRYAITCSEGKARFNEADAPVVQNGVRERNAPPPTFWLLFRKRQRIFQFFFQLRVVSIRSDPAKL